LVAVISFGGGLSVSAEELDPQAEAILEDYEQRIGNVASLAESEDVDKIDA